MNTLLLAWLLMLPMSAAAVWLGHHAPDALLPVAVILLLGLGKAWLIVLRFMELGHGRGCGNHCSLAGRWWLPGRSSSYMQLTDFM